VLPVSKTEQVESELRKLSQAELREMREWLNEDSIQRSKRGPLEKPRGYMS
jgi:hypothetical protein